MTRVGLPPYSQVIYAQPVRGRVRQFLRVQTHCLREIVGTAEEPKQKERERRGKPAQLGAWGGSRCGKEFYQDGTLRGKSSGRTRIREETHNREGSEEDGFQQ